MGVDVHCLSSSIPLRDIGILAQVKGFQLSGTVEHAFLVRAVKGELIYGWYAGDNVLGVFWSGTQDQSARAGLG
jgi:hypothetical protein